MDKDLDCERLCEVAFIAGRFEENGKIDSNGRDLFEMFEDIYKPIVLEWQNGVSVPGTFKNEEEEGYISAFAQRRLLEILG